MSATHCDEEICSARRQGHGQEEKDTSESKSKCLHGPRNQHLRLKRRQGQLCVKASALTFMNAAKSLRDCVGFGTGFAVVGVVGSGAAAE
jgi:hypothetical protein